MKIKSTPTIQTKRSRDMLRLNTMLKNLIPLIIALGLISGQLIKLPIGNNGAGTLLDLTVGALCVFGVIKLKFKLKKPPAVFSLLLLFIIVTVISLLLSPLKLQYDEFLISISYIIRLSSYVFFGWLIYSNAFSGLINTIPKVLSFSGIILAVLGLLQFLFLPNLGFLSADGWDPHYFRTASTFLDPNFLGGFLGLTLILLTVYKQKLFKNKKLFILTFLIIYIALLTTFSRSSYLLFFVSFLTLGFLLKSKQIIAILLITTLGLGIGFQAYTQAVSKPRNIDRGQSAIFRLNTWQQGILLFEKSPILGIGYNSYRYALRQYNLAGNDFTQTRGASSNDSSLLFILATTGIIGLISYISFLLLLLKESFLKAFFDKQLPSLVIFPSICGLLVHSVFNNSLFYPPVLLWIILMIVLFSKSPETDPFRG